MSRIYLDWNATAPLRVEARAAMLRAMELIGNPSSVHAEGRAAKSLIETARRQVAAAAGCQPQEVVFTSGATEAAALALAGRGIVCAGIEHDAVAHWCDETQDVDEQGQVTVDAPGRTALQSANSETGVIQDLPEGLALTDATQAFGKIPFAFGWSGAEMALVSAHKLGGPKGVGALIVRGGLDIAPQIQGGGQEYGRRSGTENLIGIAGFGAAAEAALRDIADGKWETVRNLRNILEKRIAESENETIFVGKDANRLPNTSCFLTPGWKGETQVMVMDLAGFAVSAGSACSSGKVSASRVLKTMGYDDHLAAYALRVSIGPQTEEADVLRFADVWARENEKRRARSRPRDQEAPRV